MDTSDSRLARETVVRRPLPSTIIHCCKTGKSNEVSTQVVEDESLYGKGQGVKEGDRVILNPRTVLPKEIALLEEDVPANNESQPSFKSGEMPPAKEAPTGRGGP